MLDFDKLTYEDRLRLGHKRKRDRDSWGKGTRPLNAPVTLGELCWLERVAQARTLKDTARDVGVSHVTLIKRERGAGDVSELARYWERQGTVAPYWEEVHA